MAKREKVKFDLETLRRTVGDWFADEQQEALRLLDAHAADRAALVAQLEAAERECCCGDNFQPVSGPHDCVAGSGQAALVAQLEAEQRHSRDTAGAYAEKSEVLILAEAQLAELTRERDEALAEAETAFANGAEQSAAECNARRTEVTRLTRERDEAREARRLLAGDCLAALNERDAARHQSEERFEAMTALSYEVTPLTEALAAVKLHAGRQADARVAAEARARELEAEMSKMQSAPADMLERAIAAESRLAAANADLKAWELAGKAIENSENAALAGIRSLIEGKHDRECVTVQAVRAHLAAQPATAPVAVVRPAWELPLSPPATAPARDEAPTYRPSAPVYRHPHMVSPEPGFQFARTEAEQRVLDECERLRIRRDPADDDLVVDQSQLMRVFLAELARREPQRG